MSQRYEDAKFSLTQIPNITETLATALFQNGYKTIFEIAEASPADIVGIPGFENIEVSTVVVDNAKKVVASGNVIVKTQDEKFTVVGKKTADELLKEEMQQLIEKEKEQLLTSGSEFLKIKGVGPSLIKALEEAGINDIDKLINMEEEKVLEAVAWENKDELKSVYKFAKILNNEKLIEAGKMDDVSEEEKQKFQQIPEITNSVLLRLNAAGFRTVESIMGIKIEEFVAAMGIDEKKATSIYNAARNIK